MLHALRLKIKIQRLLLEKISNDEELKKKLETNAKERFDELFTFEKYKNNVLNLLKF